MNMASRLAWIRYISENLEANIEAYLDGPSAADRYHVTRLPLALTRVAPPEYQSRLEPKSRPRMGPEIELTVTIVYEGSKARIATPKEAIPVIRHDLNAMSIPHPKTVNVSVVFPGTVRFFWTALPRSTIQHTLESRIPPHPALRAELEIRDITLRVHDEPGPRPHSGGSMNSNSGQPQMWKPDAGLYAVPMGAALQPVSLENPSVNHGEVRSLTAFSASS
ncbi:hypothetical protein B0H16DRAFT_808494 [Mycena metata]|uniref:Uncharacterized protein n=1 Tax=Mycena metata TaxID=1033252 RepID=A0AAD7NXG6_9AGAR|nr:hypothetical protein B0H16DRAFT_808494 [Mycena metata]